ncbi:ADP-ribosylglycohydrolase family protein [Flavobacterium phragmitis]|uniref:ADP-ribosylglycohydrolase n=1 Tax=Flavobacterium phragmitis TaxID=739143 RepID=A0A1I1RM26_9FLAO|nr:ADP-ribosylglycohydrolase family protein [Flavobacterium phragmitis]SFD35391.1 ADP-ribosylglycohydrolase [Flavobacterium phragmitis]
MKNKIESGLFGVAVGDALGVPYEFLSRHQMKESPAVDMIGYGTHNQPKGTWSDDSSLTFCLAETLAEGYDLQKLANRFVNWKEQNYWTPHGEVFDIGIATSIAIHELHCGKDPVLAGGDTEDSNGNGSLMRILPLLFYIKDMPIKERFQRVKEVSSLTHRHIRSVMACFIYLEYALQLYNGKNKDEALKQMQEIVKSFFENAEIPQSEIDRFHRILSIKVGEYDVQDLQFLSEAEIFSSGYVLNTLEAAIWCILLEDNYKDTVLKAVNLGSDTDTTAAVAGGLAGIYYGIDNIPEKWIDNLVRSNDIKDLADRLSKKLMGNE